MKNVAHKIQIKSAKKKKDSAAFQDAIVNCNTGFVHCYYMLVAENLRNMYTLVSLHLLEVYTVIQHPGNCCSILMNYMILSATRPHTKKKKED